MGRGSCSGATDSSFHIEPKVQLDQYVDDRPYAASSFVSVEAA
jgi:hypothetical protein